MERVLTDPILCPICEKETKMNEYRTSGNCKSCEVDVYHYIFDKERTIRKRCNTYTISLDFANGNLYVIGSSMAGKYKPRKNIFMPTIEDAYKTFKSLDSEEKCDAFMFATSSPLVALTKASAKR